MEQIKENYKEYVEGFPITGEEVENAKKKTFEIVGIPEYKVYDYQGQIKRYLTMQILFQESEVEYRPNKDAQKKIIAKCGRKLADWQGFKGEFKVLEQKIGTDIKKVLFIK